MEWKHMQIFYAPITPVLFYYTKKNEIRYSTGFNAFSKYSGICPIGISRGRLCCPLLIGFGPSRVY